MQTAFRPSTRGQATGAAHCSKLPAMMAVSAKISPKSAFWKQFVVKYVKLICFYRRRFGGYPKRAYLCNVFFMVLDLRLTKIGCRDDNQFFYALTWPASPIKRSSQQYKIKDNQYGLWLSWRQKVICNMKKGGNGRPGQSHGNKVLVIRSASVHRAVNYN